MRWKTKKYLSMAYTLGNKSAKNLCKRTVLVQLNYRITWFLYFLCTKRHGNISAQPSSLNGALNAGRLDRNWDAQPISGFIACCERCDGQLLSTRLSPIRGY